MLSCSAVRDSTKTGFKASVTMDYWNWPPPPSLLSSIFFDILLLSVITHLYSIIYLSPFLTFTHKPIFPPSKQHSRFICFRLSTFSPTSSFPYFLPSYLMFSLMIRFFSFFPFFFSSRVRKYGIKTDKWRGNTCQFFLIHIQLSGYSSYVIFLYFKLYILVGFCVTNIWQQQFQFLQTLVLVLCRPNACHSTVYYYL